jgi:hypothetical protein
VEVREGRIAPGEDGWGEEVLSLYLPHPCTVSRG